MTDGERRRQTEICRNWCREGDKQRRDGDKQRYVETDGERRRQTEIFGN